MLKFFKSRTKVMVNVTHTKLWYNRKGLVIRNTQAKYESPISYDKKVMVIVKDFLK